MRIYSFFAACALSALVVLPGAQAQGRRDMYVGLLPSETASEAVASIYDTTRLAGSPAASTTPASTQPRAASVATTKPKSPRAAGDKKCTCQRPQTIQNLYDANDVMFFGRISRKGGDVKGKVSQPLKGCVKQGDVVTMMSDSKCPFKLPRGLKATFLVAGRVYDYGNGTQAVVLNSCGWTMQRSQLDSANVKWLNNQVLFCPSRAPSAPVQCVGGQTPLQCLPCDARSRCADFVGCRNNPCNGCSSEAIGETGVIQCGAVGGRQYEQAKCPKCSNDPCALANKFELRDAGCADWSRAVKCEADTCSGCERPRWTDAMGAPVCDAYTQQSRCMDAKKLNYGDCGDVLGYARFQGNCKEITGCQADVSTGAVPPLFSSMKMCAKACHCQNFKDVDFGYNASDSTCARALAYGVLNGECALYKGCSEQFSVIGTSNQFHPSNSACLTKCYQNFEPYTIRRGRPSYWKENVHGEGVDPTKMYGKVFPKNTVKRLDIKLHPTEFQKMEDDLAVLIDDFVEQQGAMQEARKEKIAADKKLAAQKAYCDKSEKNAKKLDCRRLFGELTEAEKEKDRIKAEKEAQKAAEKAVAGDDDKPSMLDKIKEIVKMQLMAQMGIQPGALGGGTTRRQAGGAAQMQAALLQQMMGGGGLDPQMMAALMGGGGSGRGGVSQGGMGGIDPMMLMLLSQGGGGGMEQIMQLMAQSGNVDPAMLAMLGGGGASPNMSEEDMQRLMMEREAQLQAARDARTKAQWEETPPQERAFIFPRDPEYGECSVKFEGEEWHRVGMRYKGGSSLYGAFAMDSFKRGFRLNIDKYEDEYPEIKNQRFYGFKKLTFSSMSADNTFIREQLTAEIMTMAGLKVAQLAHYRVYIDTGDGPKYWGLYSMIEDPSDVMVTTYRGDTRNGDGNLYKPERNVWDKFDAHDFEKKNNKKESNYTDVIRVLDALNDDVRLTDAAAWRRGLEAVLDVDSVLRFLCVASAIGHWDSYGVMPHNYYLYQLNDKLTWIPWDHNLALMADPRMGSIMHDEEVKEQWPLIRFLMDDPVYRKAYAQLMLWLVTDGPFTGPRMEERIWSLLELVAPHVVGGVDWMGEEVEGEAPPFTLLKDATGQFQAAATDLLRYVYERSAKVLEECYKELGIMPQPLPEPENDDPYAVAEDPYALG